MNLLLPLLAFISVLLITFTVYQVVRMRSGAQEQLSKRLKSIAHPLQAQSGEPSSLLQEHTYSDIPQLNKLLARTQFASGFHRLVLQAGFKMRAGEMLLRMALIGTVAACMMFLWKGNLPLAGAAWVVGGPGGGFWYLRRRRRARKYTIARQLPDALEMIRGALQAGYSLPQALEAVSEESPDPIRSEVRQVTEELRLGHPLRSAFQGLFERTGIEDLRYFVVAVLVNREIGGNLSDIIDVVSTTIRDRFKLAAQVRALTSQGRFSALILACLTPTLLLALTVLNPEYLQPLYHTFTGQCALGYAAASTCFGYWLMRRIVDIKLVRIE